VACADEFPYNPGTDESCGSCNENTHRQPRLTSFTTQR
jgi:hypothetical protein